MKTLLLLLLSLNLLSQDIKKITEEYNNDYTNVYYFDSVGHLVRLESHYTLHNESIVTQSQWSYVGDRRVHEQHQTRVFPSDGASIISYDKRYTILADSMVNGCYMYHVYESKSKEYDLIKATYIQPSLDYPMLLDNNAYKETAIEVKYNKYKHWTLAKTRVVVLDSKDKPKYYFRKRKIEYYDSSKH
jgi:hypothetical protein